MRKDTSFLDAFRALAALWVVITHCTIWGGYDLFRLPNPKEAVDLFMILSGFLMMYTTDRKHHTTDRPHGWMAFYVRRFFRIAPAYYVSLVLLVMLWPYHTAGWDTFRALNPARWAADHVYDPSQMTLDAKNLILHVTFLFGLHPIWSFSTLLPDWSLSLEMQFYAAFPVLYLALRRKPLWVLVSLAVVCVIFTVGYEAGVRRHLLTHFREPSLLPFKLPIFIAGMLIYEAGREDLKAQHLLLALWLLVAERWRLEAHSLLFYSLVLLLIAAWTAPPWPIATRLANSMPVRIGAHASYAVYLFHGFVLSIVGSRVLSALLASDWPLAAAVAAMTAAVVLISYAAGYVIYRTIERAFIRVGERTAALLERSTTPPSRC